MARPPRDPRRPFLDASIQFGIVAGGLSLAAAVLAAYRWAWHETGDIVVAHTAAFAGWIVGHLALAAHMRQER